MHIVTQGPSYSIQPIQLDHTYTILASQKKKTRVNNLQASHPYMLVLLKLARRGGTKLATATAARHCSVAMG